ncbi:SPOR domain-containing protein [Sphingomonas sp.]|uniref:SPOR domain-containing protein n=1 Tax=Sphingomonas sp. TaxID=28214 RepID=UPI002C57E0E9|nr:SPOR domain-containing protein [Sphingomonas sp.]HWK35676.1 SPOR domain-containing protein [Sphingomonas sp.]
MNTTVDADAEGYHDEDRLPWLESAEDDYREGPTASRMIAMVVLGLLVIAAAIYGYNWWRSHQGGGGTGELIAAQEGDYKVKPDEPGGMKAEGEGDTVFATSQGTSANGSIDTRAVSEVPVAGKTAAVTAPASKGTEKVVAAVPPSGGALTAKTPTVAAIPTAGAGGGSALVQLGSFPSESAANGAWTTLSKRFTYLAPLGKSVERAEVNGRTVFRLRVNAGSAGAANGLCGKLKVAGEACYVPN